MAKQYYTEVVPRIGSFIDVGIYTKEVTREYQKYLIKQVKERWRNTIKCEIILVSRCKYNKNHIPPCYLEYSVEPNPYYGWKENQLKILKK